MATPDFNILKVTDSYHEKKLQIAYIITKKIGLNYKDTMVMLNTKKVAKEEIRSYYYGKNRQAYEKKKDKICDGENGKALAKTLLQISDQLETINANIIGIKRTNCEISAFASTQIQLAREMGQKINGVGLFLTKLMKIKEEEKEPRRRKWEDECD